MSGNSYIDGSRKRPRKKGQATPSLQNKAAQKLMRDVEDWREGALMEFGRIERQAARSLQYVRETIERVQKASGRGLVKEYETYRRSYSAALAERLQTIGRQIRAGREQEKP